MSNQTFRHLLDLPPDWANPKAAKRPIPASEELVTGWLARVASEDGFSETVALSDRFILRVVGRALPSGGVSLTLTEAADESAPVSGVTKQVLTIRRERISPVKPCMNSFVRARRARRGYRCKGAGDGCANRLRTVFANR